ncbi:hypothetical protein [Candidatus Skiveiella danica]|uniref:hypothetical protein n=1 Tax=Candidatus Skiveiella danica TaxID=3386177 RepID=UPI0039B94D22
MKPALVAALVSSFVRAMTTVSAVIFLVTAEERTGHHAHIIGRVGHGRLPGVALAYYAVLIEMMSLSIALIQFLVGETQAQQAQEPVPPRWPCQRSRPFTPEPPCITATPFGTSPSVTGCKPSAPRWVVKGVSFEVPRRSPHPRPLAAARPRCCA